jgi:hypothetical protein
MQAGNGAKNRVGQSAAGDGTLACVFSKMHNSPDEFQNTYRKFSIIFWSRPCRKRTLDFLNARGGFTNQTPQKGSEKMEV